MRWTCAGTPSARILRSAGQGRKLGRELVHVPVCGPIEKGEFRCPPPGSKAVGPAATLGLAEPETSRAANFVSGSSPPAAWFANQCFGLGVVAFSVALMLQLPAAPALALTAETCGNQVDEDGDGSTDEGCNLLGTFVDVPYRFETKGFQGTQGPWQFGAELRKGVGTPETYGQYMDYRWLMAFSSNAYACRWLFSWFDTEGPYDHFDIGGWSGTGTLENPAPPASLWTDFVFPADSGNTVPARFYTDQNNIFRPNEALGFQMDTEQCLYIGTEAYPPVANLPLNAGIDGTLLHAKDDAYFTFYLPGGRDLYINVDHLGNEAQNYDVAIQETFGSGAFTVPTFAGCSATTGCSIATSGETLRIGSGMGRHFALRVHAKAGKGRYRLFLASPVQSYPCESGVNPVEVLVDEETDFAWEGARINLALQSMVAMVLAATDGQYMVARRFEIKNGGIWPNHAYEIVFDSDCDYNCADCTAGMRHYGAFDYIEIPRWVWRGEVKTTVCPNNLYSTGATTSQVGSILAHEWGHFEWDLNDQYVTGDQGGRKKCTHSLMAGAGGMTYINSDYRYFEFCSAKDHNKEPEPGPVDATLSDWNHITAHCPTMTAPQAGGVAISSDFSQLVNLANGGLRLTMNWFF